MEPPAPAVKERWAHPLWLVLSALVACGQVLLVALTQDSVDLLLFSLLVWLGAWVCVEDRLPGLLPRPSRWGLGMGSALLVFGVWRTGRVVHLDAATVLLPPLLGLGLALLADPPRLLKRWLAPLTVLGLMPLPWILGHLLPEAPFSLFTARLAQAHLLLAGIDAAVVDRQLLLAGGGVQIAGTCTGIPLLAQLATIAVVFVLAFPLPSRPWRGAVILLAAGMALWINSLRIALLAVISASLWPQKTWWFTFFHEDAGSWVFAALGVGLFAWLYLALLDHQLRVREARRN